MHNLKIYGWSDGKSFAMNVKRGVLNIVKKNAESLTVQRLTSNWSVEETPWEKPHSPKCCEFLNLITKIASYLPEF